MKGIKKKEMISVWRLNWDKLMEILKEKRVDWQNRRLIYETNGGYKNGRKLRSERQATCLSWKLLN